MKKTYYWGISYLRIIFCYGIVALHSNIFSLTEQYAFSDVNPWWYLMLLNTVFWTGVPMFLTISCFLFIRRMREEQDYYKKRLPFIFFQYLIWGILGVILLTGGNLSAIWQWDNATSIVNNLLSTGTIYYYLLITFEVSCLSALISFVKEKYVFIIIVGFLISLVLQATAQGIAGVLSGSISFGQSLGFSNPILYLTYPFAGYLILYINTHFDVKAKRRIQLFFGILFAVSMAIEWWLYLCSDLDLSWNYVSYGRISLVWECMFLLSVALECKRKPPKGILVLSSLTAGVFLIHTIVLQYYSVVAENLHIQLNGMGIFLVVSVVTTGLVWLIKRNKIMF